MRLAGLFYILKLRLLRKLCLNLHISINETKYIDHMQKLLSLPPNLVESFADLYDGADGNEWFCASDPEGVKVGSGGGTAWILSEWMRSRKEGHLSQPKIIIHAGGQGRRLPAYAPSGKILTPIPVFRWARGQKLGQNLLSLQLPLYEKIMSKAPAGLNTLIASGDVYIRAEKPIGPLPEADVVCYGLWVDPVLATHHGVFALDRNSQSQLDFMLQKPSLETLEELSKTHMFLMDIGVWVLSDKAVELLSKRSHDEDGRIRFYDLYSDFGRALGCNPAVKDEEVNALSVAILPLPGGEFYHFGTTPELMSSTLALQNKVVDQRHILHRKIKPNPALFTQNSIVEVALSGANNNIWIENSHAPASWTVTARNVVTGVPRNDWPLSLADGMCVDIVPLGRSEWAVRPYGIDDAMRGAVNQPSVRYMCEPLAQWCERRNVELPEGDVDIQSARIFPIVDSVADMGLVVRWMTTEPDLAAGREVYRRSRKVSADEISATANLKRLFAQREAFARINWTQLSANYEKSVFYQLDLDNVAAEFHKLDLEKPASLPDDVPIMTRIRNSMLRSRIDVLNGRSGSVDEAAAFGLLRKGVLSEMYEMRPSPRRSVSDDQIVWGRSPVRIDVAGGWTDTPPYSLFAGGNVVNLAIELNGQPPLQVYVKPCQELHIVLRSIDMGAMEVIDSYDELGDYCKVGSPFSIPKAALALAGFLPEFANEEFATLRERLKAFGGGMEITLLSAIPAGSGLGTSSILASTVLGALSDFCGLAWDADRICQRTLALEQLLTTGGGWQDQYGGVLPGIKLLQTESGFVQRPLVSWLPQQLFTSPDYRECHLLYYTGITRTAKEILAEIVRSMFLNSGSHLELLSEMKMHALEMAETIQHNDFEAYGRMVGKTWEQNKRLDAGTNPPAVEAIIREISDYALGCKLPGAGGGGYLYIVAKDREAVSMIRKKLTGHAPNLRARFVDMSLSDSGFQVSRS